MYKDPEIIYGCNFTVWKEAIQHKKRPSFGDGLFLCNSIVAATLGVPPTLPGLTGSRRPGHVDPRERLPVSSAVLAGLADERTTQPGKR